MLNSRHVGLVKFGAKVGAAMWKWKRYSSPRNAGARARWTRVPRRHACCETCEPRRLLAAALVAEFNLLPPFPSIVDVGGTAFFAADGVGVGRELFKSDGTARGTVLVKDVAPGLASSFPDDLLNAGGTLYFTAAAGPGVRRLWKSDGTAAGTGPVSDVNVGDPAAGRPAVPILGAFKGSVFFAGADADGSELWKTDGTPQGTLRVKDIRPGPAGSVPQNFLQVGSTLYFTADNGVDGRELWKTDGTEAGTAMVKNISFAGGSSPGRFTPIGNKLLFTTTVGGGNQLWATEGTDVGTVQLAGSVPELADFQPMGNAVYFTHGAALWKTDGTFAGTTRVTTFGPTPAPGGYPDTPTELAALGNSLFVRVKPFGSDATQLWRSDGTAGGTAVIEYIPNVTQLTAAGGRLFFTAFDPEAGVELWATDGSAGGARRVKDVRPGPAGSSPSRLTVVGDRVFFVVEDRGLPSEVWASDGTDAGTVRVATVGGNGRAYAPHDLTDVDGTLFLATEPDPRAYDGGLIWRAKPAGDGVELVLGGGDSMGPRVTELTASRDKLFFGEYQIGPVAGPWLRAIDPASGSDTVIGMLRPDEVSWLTDVGGRLFFSAGEYFGTDEELWTSDGTPEGTALLKDIRPGVAPSRPMYLTNAGGTLFFAADDGASGRELWKSDGTVAGTVLVKDIAPGAAGSSPDGLMAVGDALFFRVPTPGGGADLWKSDGTEAGTVRVAAVGAAPYLQSWGGSGDTRRAAALGSLLLFAGADAAGGVELWRSDGTEAGTYRLADIEPGPGGSDPAWFEPFDGRVYFSAADGAGGRELWATDGTAARTIRAADVAPGPRGSNPAWLTASGGALWFTASGASPGNELWRFVPETRVVARHVFYNHSTFDGNDGATNAADDDAIAVDKAALLPGQSATFANVTSYSRGINGVIIDVAGLPVGVTLTAADFKFRSGADLSTLSSGPSNAQVNVRRGAGVGGSDRVTLTWPDYIPNVQSLVPMAAAKRWLEVTVKADANTGLAADDVFYFGNLIGDTGGSDTAFRVNALDLGAVKRELNGAATLASKTDINRDGRVNALDLGLVKQNLNQALSLLAVPIPAMRGTPVISPGLFSDGGAALPRRLADELLA